MVSKEEMVDVLKTAAVSRFSFCPGLYLAIGVSSWANSSKLIHKLRQQTQHFVPVVNSTQQGPHKATLPESSHPSHRSHGAGAPDIVRGLELRRQHIGVP